MAKQKKYAAYCGTSNIADEMIASAKSLYANSDVDKIFFIVEADIDGLPDFIECINVSDQTLFPPDGPNMNSQYTYMAMMRSALCKVLPDYVHKVFSLDSDLFAVRDCSGVWDLPIDDCYYSSSPEWHRSKNGVVYCNHGVVYYNLDKMRTGKADEIIEVLNRHYFRWVEQDVGNYLCQGFIHEMPAEYNANHWTIKDFFSLPVDSQVKTARIIHYAGEKRDKWINGEISRKWHEMSWEEAIEQHNNR